MGNKSKVSTVKKELKQEIKSERQSTESERSQDSKSYNSVNYKS